MAVRGDFVNDLLTRMLKEPLDPPFNYRLSHTIGGLPKWDECPDFDPYYHIRFTRLARPGNKAQLCAKVVDLHQRLLDRDRPLWEMYFIEGLRGGRFAIYLKLHHAIFDGLSVLRTVDRWLGNAASEPAQAPWANAERPNPNPPKLSQKLAKIVKGPPQSLERTTGSLMSLQDIWPFPYKRALEALGLRDDKMPVPFTAPNTVLDAKLTSNRAFTYIDLPMKDIKAVARRMDATINDLMTCVIDIALRRYLKKRGDAVAKPLVATMAISLRSHTNSKAAGNQVASALVRLGEQDASPQQRLRQIQVSLTEAKTGYACIPPQMAAAWSVAIGTPALLADVFGFSQVLPRAANLSISNPFGIRKRKYLGGAELESFIPVSGVVGGISLNVTLMSNVDTLHVGIIGVAESLPDIEYLARGMKIGFDQLQAASTA